VRLAWVIGARVCTVTDTLWEVESMRAEARSQYIERCGASLGAGGGEVE